MKLQMPSSGGIKEYLNNLEKAQFITCYTPYDKNINSKLKKYKLTDEYLRFYFKYVQPNLKLIKANKKRDLFSHLIKPIWNSWLGFAFENYCLKNAHYLSELMRFQDKVIQWGPYFHRADKKFQIDLIFVRSDKVITLCEIKFHNQPITTDVIAEVEKKCALIQFSKEYTLEKALISRFGPDHGLRKSGYFHHSIQIDDFFKKQYK